jgi:TetR/AcrR family transcriptional repressor of nem operon
MKVAAAKKENGASLGRPREFDEDKVLEATANAFWRRGYHATSIENLCEATGLLRGSLYAAYGDKRGIFLAALNRYCRGRCERLEKSLNDSPPGREILREGLRYYIQTGSDLDLARACFITNTALEMTPQDREVTAIIERTFRTMSALWCKAAIAARDAGEFAPGLKEKTVGDFLFCIVQGVRVLSKIYEPDELTAVVDLALSALDQEAGCAKPRR